MKLFSEHENNPEYFVKATEYPGCDRINIEVVDDMGQTMQVLAEFSTSGLFVPYNEGFPESFKENCGIQDAFDQNGTLKVSVETIPRKNFDMGSARLSSNDETTNYLNIFKRSDGIDISVGNSNTQRESVNVHLNHIGTRFLAELLAKHVVQLNSEILNK